MQKLQTFLRAHATVRGFMAALLVIGACTLVIRFALIPMYRNATGFLPFDAQPGLSPFSIGVQLGAFPIADARWVYLPFAVFDALSVLATAWVFALLWTWLFDRAPTRLFAFLTRGGFVLVPFYVLVFDLAGKVGFFRLVSSGRGDATAALVDLCVWLHRFEYGFITLRNDATIAFLLVIAWTLIAPRFKRGA